MEKIIITIGLKNKDTNFISKILSPTIWKLENITGISFHSTFSLNITDFKNYNDAIDEIEDFLEESDTKEGFPIRDNKSNVQKLNPGPPERPVYIEIVQKESKIQRV